MLSFWDPAWETQQHARSYTAQVALSRECLIHVDLFPELGESTLTHATASPLPLQNMYIVATKEEKVSLDVATVPQGELAH